LQVRYAKQVRFSFSVALVNKEKGEVSVRINPFDYTNKNIITILEFKKLVDAEISRGKGLDCDQEAWVASKRLEGALYMNSENLVQNQRRPKNWRESLSAIWSLVVGRRR